MEDTPERSGLAALIREPLLQYLLLGLLAFGLYSWLGEGSSPSEPADRVLSVSAEQINSLVAVWKKKWNRSPTESELRGMIAAVVREEILSREAIALGLDRDDAIVRRRLAQKIEYLIRDLAPPPEPTEAELQAFLTGEEERYHQPPRIAFAHVYFSADRRGTNVDRDAEETLARLRAAPDLDREELGDTIMLEPDQALDRLTNIERRFGPDFAKGLDQCKAGTWEGPVVSAYGLHLVRVTKRLDGGAPPLDQVREEVRRDLMVQRREQARAAFYDTLRGMYRIEVDEAAVQAHSLRVEDPR